MMVCFNQRYWTSAEVACPMCGKGIGEGFYLTCPDCHLSMDFDIAWWLTHKRLSEIRLYRPGWGIGADRNGFWIHRRPSGHQMRHNKMQDAAYHGDVTDGRLDLGELIRWTEKASLLE